MFVIELTDADVRQVEMLLADITARAPRTDDEEFLAELTVYGQELPRAMRVQANRFRLQEPTGACLFRGFAVADDRLGDTPRSWCADEAALSSTLREDVFLLLCASLLGDPISWATQQSGRLLHDVIPIKGHELEQINSSTAAPLWWHTEDAFHPHRAEYVGLMCLRNPDAVETTYAMFDDLELDAATRAILSEPRFVIRPDESHLAKNRAATNRLAAPAALLERSYAWVKAMNDNPPLVPILYGDPDRPYGRLDPYFMDRMEDDTQAMTAFDTLVKEIDDKITGIALRPGEVLFVDNNKTVHGRKPFVACFDGRDRWLRRVNVTRDRRQSRGARATAGSHTIF